MLKKTLRSKVSGIVRETLRAQKGLLTEVSDMAGVNRKEFNRRNMDRMKLYKLVRVMYALCLVEPVLYAAMMDRIRDEVSAFVDEHEEDYFMDGCHERL